MIKRKCITKLRLSCHKLAIETERYKTGEGRLLPHERLCKFCDLMEVEDECHFITSCKIYENERKLFFNTIEKNHDGFMKLNNQNKFMTAMSSLNSNVYDALGEYIYKCFNLRKNHTVN